MDRFPSAAIRAFGPQSGIRNPSTSKPSMTTARTDPDQVVLQDSASAPKLRKLRLSCDSCHAAKVKCSKNRPSCLRCAKSAVPCIYSVSRRAGKPKRAGKYNRSFGSSASSATVAESLPSFPPIPVADLSMDADMGLMQAWHVDSSSSNGLSASSQPQTSPKCPDLKSQSTDGYVARRETPHPSSSADSNSQLESLLRVNNLKRGLQQSEDFWPSLFNPDVATAGTEVTPDWMFDMAPEHNAVPFSFDSISSVEGISRLESPNLKFSPEERTIDKPSLERCSPPSCRCSTALHETLSTLIKPSLFSDHLLATNKSAVTRVTDHLYCQCMPDISSIMMLSVIITKVVQWYRRSRQRCGYGSEEAVGVTMGILKMDSEDEFQIKTVLVRSELRKIKMVMTHARWRFEEYPDGQEKQLFEANMTFLEQVLQGTIRSL